VYVTERTQISEAVIETWKDIGGVKEEFMPGGNVSVEHNDLCGIDEEITNVEVKWVVEQLKINKAAGMDEIPYEMYE
jgi:hypothetical protein